INHVVKDISFTVERPETICILGPSGCGKTTILRVVSGMRDRYVAMPTSGQVKIEGTPVTAPHPKVLTVFQRPVLKAWLDVRGNVALPFRAGLWGKGVSKEERDRRVEEMVQAVGLGQASKLRPKQLSGGMKQRVSLAARLVLRPAILCLDEPFSALDPETRLEMHRLVLELWQRFPCTALFVTHDVSEALRLADRIIVLSTRPATVVMDVNVVEPKPRSETWMRSAEYTDLEQRIIARIREATARERPHGTVAVDV
ncbi:MAG TPA: ABC transporter ATP-binding protein, partial [Kofleriaceae bacterium]|nr:ABC transporter ATP-binding protein [Kofleriaceae bacterium]